MIPGLGNLNNLTPKQLLALAVSYGVDPRMFNLGGGVNAMVPGAAPAALPGAAAALNGGPHGFDANTLPQERSFGGMGQVAGVAPGVNGTTGPEAADGAGALFPAPMQNDAATSLRAGAPLPGHSSVPYGNQGAQAENLRLATDRRSDGHYYNFETVVCSNARALSKADMADALGRFSVPGLAPGIRARNKMVVLVADPRWQFPAPGGFIEVYVSPDGLTVKNTAMIVHALAGTVTRRAYVKGNSWYVRTIGRGTHRIEQADWFNQKAGPEIFVTMNNRMKKWIAGRHRECGKPDPRDQYRGPRIPGTPGIPDTSSKEWREFRKRQMEQYKKDLKREDEERERQIRENWEKEKRKRKPKNGA